MSDVFVSELPYSFGDEKLMSQSLEYDGESRDHDTIAQHFGYTQRVSEGKGKNARSYHIVTYRGPKATLHVSIVGG